MYIEIQGARENNLKNINVRIPKNKLVAFTGISGSSKSTLAMETLQRECQRQFMESMGMITNAGSRPKVDSIQGLAPAISINQHFSGRNPRSTVATITDLAPYIRVLYWAIGQRICPHCGKHITAASTQTTELSTETPDTDMEAESIYDQKMACPHCGESVLEFTSSHFSFNKPQGACPACKGIGVVSTPDIEKLYDKTKSIREFAIDGWDQVYIDRYGAAMEQAGSHYGFSVSANVPIETYGEIQMDLLLYGVLSPQFIRHFPNTPPPKTVPGGRFEGIVTNLMRRYNEKAASSNTKRRMEKMLIQKECPDCQGKRYRKETLDVKINGYNIIDFMALSIHMAKDWLKELENSLSEEQRELAGHIMSSIMSRVSSLVDVGVSYLSLDQAAASLSAGELQRIKMASILGGGLTGVLYILDEPTSGLHECDLPKIIKVLCRLRDMGNTVIVIEHNLNVIRAADYIIDFGPGAGKEGGEVAACGSVQKIIEQGTLTGQYLSGTFNKMNHIPRMSGLRHISIKGADANNLKSVNVDIPTGLFVTVAGVSGSGKTSLIFGSLSQQAEEYFQTTKKHNPPGVTGLEQFDAVVTINQASIGRSGRSTPATYTEVFTNIRDLFASLPQSKKKRLTARDFSCNTIGGRCENCQGYGRIIVPMYFLPDVEVTCPVCRGKRYQKQVLEALYKGYSISDVLDMSINEAAVLFDSEDTIKEKLAVLQDVGLGYLGLGQSSSTLSGGEAQRLKLARELSRHSNAKTLYLFDEPTTGLHPYDTDRLIRFFNRLVQAGNTVVVIEHNLSVIMASDWIIEMGPRGGIQGGTVIAQGTPDQIINDHNSITGKMLRRNS